MIDQLFGKTAGYIGPGILTSAGMEVFGAPEGAPRGAYQIGYGEPGSGGAHFTLGRRGLPVANGFSAEPFKNPAARASLATGLAFGTGMSVALGLLPSMVTGESISGRLLWDIAVSDVAINSAVHRLHYVPHMDKAKSAKLIRPGIWGGWGGSTSYLSRVWNSGTFFGKYITGGIGGYLGGMVGGGIGRAIGGTPGDLLGSALGMFGGSYMGAALFTPQGMITAAVGGGLAAGTAMTVGAAAAVGYGTYSTLRAGYRYRQMQKGIHTSGSLAAFHTQGAQTMRARAVQAIHKSHLNARSALGQEANFMHFPSKNYHSRYRRF